MAAPVLAELEAAVTKSTTVMSSAKMLIDGFATRMQAAIDAALENGATADQLAPVTAEVAALNSGSDALAAAVQANT